MAADAYSSKGSLLKFILDNWMLISIALASGVMLLLPTLQGAAASGLSPVQAVQMINREKAQIVDVCSAEEFANGHLVGSRNVPLEQLEQQLASQARSKTTPLILVCASGIRSKRAVAIAKKLGYEQAHSLAGGIKAWKEANLPLEKA
jgi:rhodanese-related sulfurtransferase